MVLCRRPRKFCPGSFRLNLKICLIHRPFLAISTMEQYAMIDILNRLYRHCSQQQGITPNQSHALAGAACVLGSRGMPASAVREAIVELEAAFENPSVDRVIPWWPVFSGFISELSAG
jgi:hypothetical protein